MSDVEFGRRQFIEEILKACGAGTPLLLGVLRIAEARTSDSEAGYDPKEHLYGLGIDVNKCIGCARCVVACKAENDVPAEPHYFNTWIERYILRTDGTVQVDSPNGGMDGFPPIEDEGSVLRSFFVPKLCNHCANPPCVQVCPVGATFSTQDGVVLVDQDYCVGCRYCIQACPYGARWFHPTKHVASKCTLCYHRVVKGQVPACVEACPTGARQLVDFKNPKDPVHEFLRHNKVQVLKPHMATEAKVYYKDLDGSVR